MAVAGTDRFCPRCAERVPGNFGVCWSCGASMEDASRVVARETVATATGAGAFDADRRRRFSTIAHADHLFMSPLAEEKVERVLAAMRPGAGHRVVDIGCGSGEMLIRLIEMSARGASTGDLAADGLGIDRNEAVIEIARRRARERSSRVAETCIEWRVGDASPLAHAGQSFDAAMCIGASGALGGFRSALGALRRIVRHGGCIVIGEGFWRKPPHPEYLAALGASVDDMLSHGGNVEAAVASGWTPIYAVVSSDDEWDHYEGLYIGAMERWLAANSADPDHAVFADRIRGWRTAYLRWGRATLGFGVYVLRRRY